MKHGANIYKYAKALKCEPQEIIDFSSNINFYQPPVEFCADTAMVAKYADNSYPELKQTIAKRYKLTPKNITLFNGATAAIYALMQKLKGKTVYLYAPLYGEYEAAALAAKKDVYKINRIEDIDAEVEKKAIVVFVNPSTPEGSYYDVDELFLEWKKKKCTIILDESFIEFQGHKSLRRQVQDYKKLYVIQSFSKFYSCGGVRIGAVFTHKDNAKTIAPPLWSISSLDAAFLQQRLEDESFVQQSKTLHKEQKAQLLSILNACGHFELIVESDANFILTKSPQAQALFQHLLAHKILTRSCQSFDFLSDEWLRFAVKDKAAHAALQSAFESFSV